MTQYLGFLTLLCMLCTISAFIGFALGEKNSNYSCSVASRERIQNDTATRIMTRFHREQAFTKKWMEANQQFVFRGYGDE